MSHHDFLSVFAAGVPGLVATPKKQVNKPAEGGGAPAKLDQETTSIFVASAKAALSKPCTLPTVSDGLTDADWAWLASHSLDDLLAPTHNESFWTRLGRQVITNIINGVATEAILSVLYSQPDLPELIAMKADAAATVDAEQLAAIDEAASEVIQAGELQLKQTAAKVATDIEKTLISNQITKPSSLTQAHKDQLRGLVTEIIVSDTKRSLKTNIAKHALQEHKKSFSAKQKQAKKMMQLQSTKRLSKKELRLIAQQAKGKSFSQATSKAKLLGGVVEVSVTFLANSAQSGGDYTSAAKGTAQDLALDATTTKLIQSTSQWIHRFSPRVATVFQQAAPKTLGVMSMLFESSTLGDATSPEYNAYVQAYLAQPHMQFAPKPR